MDKALTIGDVAIAILAIGGIIGVLALIFFVLSLINPFRSGH